MSGCDSKRQDAFREIMRLVWDLFFFLFFFGWGVLLFHKSMNCLFNLSNDENIVAYFCLFCFYLYGRHINNAGLWGMRSGALLESSALQEKSRHPTTRFFTGHSVTWQCTLWCPEVCFIEMFRDIIFQWDATFSFLLASAWSREVFLHSSVTSFFLVQVTWTLPAEEW